MLLQLCCNPHVILKSQNNKRTKNLAQQVLRGSAYKDPKGQEVNYDKEVFQSEHRNSFYGNRILRS
jgi:hypothetical protein